MPQKPMLSVNDLIAHLQSKGILFSIMSAEDANMYLSQNNNFFKLTSYRKNYTKRSHGPNAGKYENLEFAYLIELARIDVEIRHILLKMCLDIEHFLKVYLIKFIEDRVKNTSCEDGYKIVLDFISDANRTSIVDKAENIRKRSSKLASRLQNTSNPYCGELISKYKNDMPIWALVEIISFGDLLDIISYCVDNYGMKLPVDKGSLDRVRQIRNATAHNNCIINNLCSSVTNGTKTPFFITKYVSSAGVSENMRNKKLSNPRINQIVHLLYVYKIVVTSNNTRTIRIKEFKDLMKNRMLENKDYFKSNTLLTSTYDFFLKLVENF